jgi:hypothetical protein
MKKKMIKLAATLTVLVVIFSTILGWGYERKSVVTSEPMHCVEMGDSLVCFDGQPQGSFVCENADDNTILCLP